MSDEYEPRYAVRALLFAEDTQRVLLIHTHIPDTNKLIWLAPGGGVETDEPHDVALKREVYEETGLAVETCSGPVWHRQQKFYLHGKGFDQYEEFFWVPTTQFDADNSNNPALSERDIFRGFRWWSLQELQAETDEIFVPLTIASHLAQILAQGLPAAAIDVGR